MTFTNTNSIEKAVKAFQQLPSDQQLATLATLYRESVDSLHSAAANATPSKPVAELLAKVKDLREENQIQLIQDILSQKQTEQTEVALDPHPSKALLELVPGAGAPPISQYNDLSESDRLTFWYQLAQQVGSAIPNLSSEQPSELMSSLRSANLEEKIAFLKQVV